MSHRGAADEVAIVTGAAGALGRATALRLGADGYRIGVLDRPSDALHETTSLLHAEGITALTLETDLRDPDLPGNAIP